MIDVTAFRAFEQAGWDERAESYDRFFSSISERNIGPLLDAAEVRSGAKVLDAGCGPGNLAAAAAERGASVVGIDMSDGMIALAKRRHPHVDFRQADAEHLPFSDGTFDVGVSNLLVPHLPSPEVGVAELVRVVKSGGRLAASMWDAPSRSRFIGIMWESIAEVGAPPPPGLPAGPPTLKYSNEDELLGLLRSSGLEHVNLRHIEFSLNFKDAKEVWDAWTQGSVRTRSAVVDQPEEVQRRIRASFERRARVYSSARGLNIPVSFLISSGRKR